MKGKKRPSAQNGLHVLVVDDDLATLKETCSRLGSEGHRVSAFSCATGLKQLIDELEPDLVLIDVLMPDLTRAALAGLLKASRAKRAAKIILHSSITERMLRTVAETQGSVGVVQKTESPLEFLLAFNAIVDRLERAANPELGGAPTAFSGTHRIRSDEGEGADEDELRTGNTR